MTMELAQFAQPLSFDHLQQMVVVNGAIGRLLMACLLGGLIGMDREFNRKSAGIRTNLLICMGCAFFTLLSAVLAGEANPDKGRVAANIVQGIGFLGAGLILHNRNRVSGLTSAASVFVVASIGMACGAGLYAAAAVATAIVIMALEAVGFIERRANLKVYSQVYEVRGSDQDRMMESILDAMDSLSQRLSGVDSSPIGALQRVSFTVTATKKQHERLNKKLLTEPGVAKVLTYFDPEED
jgi:putative Mg2+ transporter-C (MgtC) family protein